LTYGNINGGKTGKSIEFRVQKTDEMLNFSLPKRAIYFLGEGLPQEKVFQMGTNQYSNRELKNIMTTAEINKNIHMHCSRHTFGTIALELGVPLEVVQKIMGHRNISTTKRYAKVVDASVKKGMMMMDGM
jgi:integrase